MDENKTKRINELSRKSKEYGLTPEEQQEQKLLRDEYIQAFRNNLKTTLDNIVVVEKDGTRRTLRKNN